MTTTMRFDELFFTTHEGKVRRESFRDASLVSITGPSQAGKTSFLDCLLYPLGVGGRRDFQRAVRENVAWIETTVTIERQRLRLVRSLARQPNRIEASDARSGEKLALLDTSGTHGPTPSQWLFEQMGWSKLLAGVEVRNGTIVGAPCLSDVAPFFYIAQHDIDQQVMRHERRDQTRRTLFELLMGLSDADVESAKNLESRLKNKLSTKRAELRRLDGFVSKTSRSLEDLTRQLETEREAQTAAEGQLKQLRVTTNGSTLPTTQVLNRSSNPVSPQWACPRCHTDLTVRSTPQGCCALCLEPIPSAGASQRSTSITAPAAQALGKPSPAQAMMDAHGRLERARESITNITEMLAPHRELGRLRTEIAKLEIEKAVATEAVKQARHDVASRDGKLADLSDTFTDTVTVLKPPYFQHRARINVESYLPEIANDDFATMGSGMRVTANIAYHAALLRHALTAGDTWLPSILIIDSPQRNLGANRTDRAHASRVYQMFQDLKQSRGDLPGYTGSSMTSRPFQLIVVDNDVPGDITGGVRHIKFSHDEPLVPGVHYEQDEG